MLDINEYAGLLLLAQHWGDIADECRKIDHYDRLHISRDGKTHEQIGAEVIAGGKNGWVDAWAPGWFNYGLCLHDRYPLPVDGLETTVELLRRLRGIKVAALALFEPGTILRPHRHPELAEDWGIFHLGLEMAEVGVALWTETDGFVAEEESKAITFDGNDLHYAFNSSEYDRLILAIEFNRKAMQRPVL